VEAVVLAVRASGISIGYIDEEEEYIVWAVRRVDLAIEEGDAFCLVGESGSGKTTFANAIAGILPPHVVTRGKLYIFDRLAIDESTWNFNGLRGRVVSYIPQNPGTSLSPFLTIEEHFYHVLRDTLRYDREKSRRAAIEALLKVGLDRGVLEDYPHELSGGMQQRVLIAIALASNAKIIVADEPTSAIDANLRASVLQLLGKLNREYRVTLLIVTHDLASTSIVCNRLAVMLAGKIVETGRTISVLRNPQHPYTKMLLDCIPLLGVKKPLKPLPGEPIQVVEDKAICPFRERCPRAIDKCVEEPPLKPIGDEENHYVKCWRLTGGESE
jgi:oligopeptide/dipeptide ABC transporter ATP-binding protein